MKFCSVDADNAGSRVGRAVRTNDPNKVRAVANLIESGETLIAEWVQKNGGNMISYGGDEARFIVDDSVVDKLESLRKQYFELTGFTLSVGVGSEMIEGEDALIYAKLTGKDKIVTYSRNIDSALTKLKRENELSEESKLRDAYFKSERINKSQLEDALAGDDEEAVRAAASKNEAVRSLVSGWISSVGGELLAVEGGRVLLKLPKAMIGQIEDLRQQYSVSVGSTCSVGVGKKLSEATKARMLGKLTGKNKTVVFDDTTEKELELRLQDKDTTEANKMRVAMRPEMKPVEANAEPKGQMEETESQDSEQAESSRWDKYHN